MAKRRQQPTSEAAKDDQPITPAADDVLPPPSKQQEEEEDKFEERSSEEDSSAETTSSSEEDDDDEETPPSQPARKATPTTENDEEDIEETDDEEDEEEEEEEETDEEDEPPLKLKPQPKPSVAPAKSGTKRTADDNNPKEAKKPKRTSVSAVADGKKKLFERIFSKDYDVAILKGLAEIVAETGEYKTAKHLTEFHGRVDKSLSFRVERIQLKDKIQRLKKKFLNSGKPPTFSEAIDEQIYKLSKEVWGDNVGIGVIKKESGTGANENHSFSLVLNRIEDFDKSVGYSWEDMKRGLEYLEESKRIEFYTRWSQLRVALLDLFARRSKLVEEHTTIILDAMRCRSSSSC